MENNIEVIENIMKPYFDKKVEVDNVPVALENEKNEYATKIRDMRTERIEKRKSLELELENLRERNKRTVEDFKEKMVVEIEEYISNAKNSNANFFTNYGAMLRKDLEQEYARKLKEIEDNFKVQESNLISQISELKSVSVEEKAEKESLENLNKKSSYRRVDLRELVEIKGDLRKQLISEQKRLNSDLRRSKIEFDMVMLKISDFKYEYNEQQQVINGSAMRELYEESNKIVDKMNEIKIALSKIEEYLNLTNLTQEESKAIMMSMTPWEREEYDRRKASHKVEETLEVEDIVETEDEKEEPEIEDELEIEKEEEDVNEDVPYINDPVVSEYEVKKVVVDDFINLLKTIYNDIVKETENLRSVQLSKTGSIIKDSYIVSSKDEDDKYKINGVAEFPEEESIRLPDGEYVNSEEIKLALYKYRDKNKGKSYVVRSSRKKYKVSRFNIEKLIETMKELSAITLVKEKKISKLDLLKNFGKKRTDKIMAEVELEKMRDITVPEGSYINRNEFVDSLNNLFTTKKLEWLKNLSSSLKDKKDTFVSKFKKDTEETVEIDEDFNIKQK